MSSLFAVAHRLSEKIWKRRRERRWRTGMSGRGQCSALFNDPGFTPPASNLGPPAVSAEAFLSLTQQVQTLVGMVQISIPYIPQLAQALAHQRPDAPRQTPQQGIPQSSLTRGEHPDNGGPCCLSTEVTVENLNTSVMQPVSCSWNVIHVPSKLDAISSYSIDSVGEQLRQVNQRLDEVQREFVKSKEEIGESSKGGSPFVPEILDKPIPANFWLPILEHYDGSTDPSEHIATFRA
ncbi:hypothetical protein B296_00027992 [Ensete ventricosum]|uniref:Uncharacterized protein n=1 Tax=Ensete ventricosum TaxID=4639 RepID=A0A426ZBD8_ENSVE|nr:hypothetical protein B296_00027992 [Ensete ventricosum]